MAAGLLLAVVALSTGVYAGDVCLQCDSVAHPEYCRSVERCQDGEACYIDEHVNHGHVTFSLGCRRHEVCDRNNTLAHHSHSDVKNCTHCCHGDLCNANGCNETAYKHDRGPICYWCSMISHPDECDRITVCGRDEACLLSTDFGSSVRTYSARCEMKMVCQAVNRLVPAIVGKRDEKQVRNAFCTKCCDDDLCNDGCNTADVHDHCYPNPCVHGTCTSVSTGYSCSCQSGFTGKNCDIDIDECVYGVCHHGHCINTLGGFVCTCDHGYNGHFCNETNNNPCSPTLCQQGTCYSRSDGSYHCACHTGYTGANCDLDIDECLQSSNCQHGTCENTPGGYNCHCNHGYAGAHCSIHLVETSSMSPLSVSHSSHVTTNETCKDLTSTLWCETYKNSCHHKTIAYNCPRTCRVPGCPGTTVSPPTTMTTTTTTTPSTTTTTGSANSCIDTVENCAFMHTLQSTFCLSSLDYAKIHCRQYCRFC